MTTSLACVASASRSSGSEVSTVPPGSAAATTSASIADPRRALRRRRAARRASSTDTASVMRQVFRNRFSLASSPAWLRRHSTRTTERTVGGQSPSCLSATMRASESRDRSASRVTPPESRTSTDSSQFFAEADDQRSASQAPSHEPSAWTSGSLPPATTRWCTSGSRPTTRVAELRHEQHPAATRMPADRRASPPGRARPANTPASAAYA